MRNKAKAEHHRVTRLSAQQQSYQVDTSHNPGSAGHGDYTHGVNLLQRSYTCQKWKLYRNEMDEGGRRLRTTPWKEGGRKVQCGLCDQEGHNRKTCPKWNEVLSSGLTD